MEIEVTEKEKQKFWSHVEKTDFCWLWKRGKNAYGYGMATVGGKTMGAHRASFWIHTGVHPGKLLCCHRCDNPPCVNPDHIFLGTYKDNYEDMKMKGRARRSQKLLENRVTQFRIEIDVGDVLRRIEPGQSFIVDTAKMVQAVKFRALKRFKMVSQRQPDGRYRIWRTL